MTRFARRIYYLSAFLVFAIVGPLLVAWTAGYRWSTSRAVFIRTGSLTVTSEPRASLRLNGVDQGATPFRATHLTPGTYVVELSRPGVKSWRQEVAISANVALTIGPVVLYPEQFSPTQITTNGQSVLSTADKSAAFEINSADGQSTARQIWPTTVTATTVLPWEPTYVARSRSGQTLLWQSGKEAIVTFKNPAEAPWVIDPIDDVQFDPSSEAILYGRQGPNLVRYDTLTREHSQLAVGSSFTTLNDTLWLTQEAETMTTIMRQPAFGQHVPDTLFTLPGRWSFVASPAGTLLLHNLVTRELATVSQTFGSEQFTTASLGVADHWWWTEANESPLWLNGSDLMTLNEKKETQLIDRLSESPAEVAWIVPGHILWLSNDHRLSITSVSLRQGRGVLLQQVFDQPTSVVGLDITNKRVLVSPTTLPLRLTELRW